MRHMHNKIAMIIVLTMLVFTDWHSGYNDRKNLSKTTRNVRLIAALLALYHQEHGGLYPPPPFPPTKQIPFPLKTDYGGPFAWPVPNNRDCNWLEPYITTRYFTTIPIDGWGHSMLCDVSPDRKNYTIISLGRDAK